LSGAFIDGQVPIRLINETERQQGKEKFIPRKDIPHSGWSLIDTVDYWSADFVCMNCRFRHVRYVHELKHKRTGKLIKVGCVCAEHLTQDFATPRLRETALKSRAGRRMRWPTLNWKRSSKGNLFLKKQRRVIVVRPSSGGWLASYKSDDGSEATWVSVKGLHDTAEEAKLAAFDALYPPSGGNSRA